jgi:hypothetical protein
MGLPLNGRLRKTLRHLNRDYLAANGRNPTGVNRGFNNDFAAFDFFDAAANFKLAFNGRGL